MSMFCFQCEQTAQGKGCTHRGVCGKFDTTAKLQDEIVRTVKEIGFYNHHLRQSGQTNTIADHKTLDFLFATVTNVNFDDTRLAALLAQAKELARQLQHESGATPLPETTVSVETSVARRREILGDDVHSLQELLTYGLKGTAAYVHHSLVLGQESDEKYEEIYSFFAESLAALATNTTDINDLIGLCLACGRINLIAMERLDTGHTTRFGHPVPTPVRITPKQGKAILVSGHDLCDLEELLKQTAGKGIDIYTHGEMLPAHGYPILKSYPHLVGNYGGAWQDQQKEFAEFPGAILMTTNCIQQPKGYDSRLFTTGCVAWPGIFHIADRPIGGEKDFSPVIATALAAPGFLQDGEEKNILVGFGHKAVLDVASQVVDAVKSGKIKHFYLIGGCDGAKSGRNYYTDFAQKVPNDCIILTLACGKYRFNKMEFGDIGGIPRLLDLGQCNDAFSAIRIAVALAEAFGTDINELPLSMILSWYEQKAVCILLTLLSLGVKNIKLGPSLPAFVSPAVLKVLVDTFAIAPISTPEFDMRAIPSQQKNQRAADVA